MAPARRNALLIAGTGLVAAAAGAVGGALWLQARSGAAELLSARYPDLDGRERRLLEWQGRVVLCNFWATWCAPCLEEIPLLVAAKRDWVGRGFEVVGIGIDSADKIRQFAKTFQVNYPLLIADGSALGLMRRIGNHAGGLPYSVILDRTGAIAHRHLGAFSESDLRRLLVSLFN